jgi:hypothetical protein
MINRPLNLQEKLGSYVNQKYKPVASLENAITGELRNHNRFSLMPEL